MQLFVRTPQGRTIAVDASPQETVLDLKRRLQARERIPAAEQLLVCGCKPLADERTLEDCSVRAEASLRLLLRLRGGMDRQNREGAKPGGVGERSGAQEAQERKERLRKLAMETIDLTKDPYFMRNHLGTFECKLCLTLHPTEASYLAHTQAKRHQQNLARRAAREAREGPSQFRAAPGITTVPVRSTIKIGRPGYKVVKQRDPVTNQRSLLFEIAYPEIEKGFQPRHRFMSAFEQRVEAPDRDYQYLLFAAEPYETIAFKIPNKAVDKGEGKFVTHWDRSKKVFMLQLYFVPEGPDQVPR